MPIMSGNNMFVQQFLALLVKDLRAEWRTREIFTSMFVFAVLVVVIFNFAIGSNPALIRQVAPGVLWVASILFGTHFAFIRLYGVVTRAIRCIAFTDYGHGFACPVVQA